MCVQSTLTVCQAFYSNRQPTDQEKLNYECVSARLYGGRRERSSRPLRFHPNSVAAFQPHLRKIKFCFSSAPHYPAGIALAVIWSE